MALSLRDSVVPRAFELYETAKDLGVGDEEEEEEEEEEDEVSDCHCCAAFEVKMVNGCTL